MNIGAGTKVFEGWLSVGLEDDHAIKSDLRKLEIPDDYADEAMAIHVLEHLYRWEAPAALAEWFRVMKPGAMLAIEMPELYRCCAAVLAKAEPRNGLLGLFGDPVYCDPLMVHKWAWTEEELKTELKKVGFRKIKSALPQFHGKRRNRDMRLEAWK